jgi:hypothetical protein
MVGCCEGGDKSSGLGATEFYIYVMELTNANTVVAVSTVTQIVDCRVLRQMAVEAAQYGIMKLL